MSGPISFLPSDINNFFNSCLSFVGGDENYKVADYLEREVPLTTEGENGLSEISARKLDDCSLFSLHQEHSYQAWLVNAAGKISYLYAKRDLNQEWRVIERDLFFQLIFLQFPTTHECEECEACQKATKIHAVYITPDNKHLPLEKSIHDFALKQFEMLGLPLEFLPSSLPNPTIITDEPSPPAEVQKTSRLWKVAAVLIVALIVYQCVGLAFPHFNLPLIVADGSLI